MYREAPFDQACTDLNLRYDWWVARKDDTRAHHLAVSLLLQLFRSFLMKVLVSRN
jgi:hypothetical protein